MFKSRSFPRTFGLCLLAATLIPLGSANADNVELNIIWMGWPDEHVKPMVDAFKADHPDIDVNYERVPFNQLFQTIDVRLNSRGADPDVYIVDSPLTASYAVRGHLLDLGPHIDSDRFTAAGIAAAKSNDKIYSAPMASSSALLYYNKDLFRKAGLDEPSGDPEKRLTWAQTVELAKEIRNQDDDIWGLIIEQSERPYQLLPIAQSMGAKVISDDGLESAGYVDSPEFVKAAQFYQNLYNEWDIAPKGVFDNKLAQELFGTGKSGFLIGGPWMLKILQNYPDLNWGVAPHPYFEEGDVVTPTGSWHIGINPRTDAKDAALAFVKWYITDEAQQKWFGLRGYPPVLNSMWDLEAETFSAPAWKIMRYEMQNTGVPRPATPGWREYEDILRVAFRDIQTGADPQAALTKAAGQIDRELAKYNQ